MVINGMVNLRDATNYFNLNIRKVKSNKELNPLIMSMHTGFMQADYTPITEIEEKIITSKSMLTKLVFESSSGRKSTVICTSDQRFFVREKGFIECEKLNKTYVFIDDEGRLCKLISNEEFETDMNKYENRLFGVGVKFNNNYFYNGILVR